MITIEDLRKQAIEQNLCCSETALKRDYKMQLRPGTQPVKFYTNQHNRQKYAVYKITDCDPIPEKPPKPPRTQKQIEASKKRARLNSKRGQAALTAQAWLAADALFIDTETTGLNYNDQVIELAVVDSRGQILLETRLRPSVPVGLGAQDIHGISAANLANAPTWTEISPRLRQLLEGRQVVAFNHDFDSRLLQQTAHAFADNYWSLQVKEHCAMALAAQAFGSTNRYRSISLSAAVTKAGITWQGEAHSAAGDALTTLAVVKAIADFL